jgi:hypothetical protein
MGSKHSVCVIYDDRDALEAALRRLGQEGFPIQQVSVIAQDFDSEKRICCNINSSSAVASAGLGTVGVSGFPLQAAYLWVAGSMRLVVAGPLTTVLLEFMEQTGDAESGTLDWLAPLGLPEEIRRKYEESVKAQKYLVIAQGAVKKVKKAWQILKTTNPVELVLNI